MKNPRQIKPARCTGTMKEEYWEDPAYLVQPKLDGVRYLMHIGSEVEKPYHRFTSRRISSTTGLYVEKTGNFPHLNSFQAFDYEGTVLDGEIVCKGGIGTTSHDVTKITGCKPARAIERQQKWGLVEYHVWDILFYKGKDVRNFPLYARQDFLLDVVSHMSPFIKCVPSYFKDKKAFYEAEVERGAEGVVLKHRLGKYEAKAWIKVKDTITHDVVVMGFKAAEVYTIKSTGELSLSNYHKRGWIGSIEFGQYDKEGKLRHMGYCSGINEGLRAMISNNREDYLGRVFEVRALADLKSGKLHSPQFLKWRPDKNAEDCKRGGG